MQDCDKVFEILWVEDNVAHARVYETTISYELNCNITFAYSGKEALDILEAQSDSFDLMILDLGIPEISGQEILKILRADRRYDGLPIMILTGDSNPSTQTRLLEDGANEFLEKGAVPEVVVSRINNQLRHKHAIDQATQIAMEMDMFTAGVLHDIKNMEANTTALCELVRMQLTNDKPVDKAQVLGDIDQLKAQAQRLGNYAKDILGQVRETAAQARLEPISIRDTLRWVDQMMTQDSRRESPIEFESDPHMVLADSHLLKLALLNLVQNSIKYAQDGVPVKILVDQTIDTDNKGRLWVVTRLRDNGVGIPKDELVRVFEPFKRGSSAGRTSGHGLGLAMVTKVIGKMGGRVWAEAPQDGPGTVMAISLPPAS